MRRPAAGGVYFAGGTYVFRFGNSIIADNFAPEGTGIDLAVCQNSAR